MTKAITEVSLDKNENEILTNGEKPQLLKQPFQPTHPIEYWIKLYQENYEQMLSKGVHEPNSAGWISLLKRLQSVTDEQVEIAKARIRQLVTESEPGTYDERLIEEHMVERRIRHYLAREKKFEENLQIMIDSIQYKNGFLHNYTDDSCFPREFIEFGLFTISGLDRYGSPVLHVIGRHIFANRQLLKLAEPYLAYVLFRVEKLAMATSGFWTLCVDLSEAGISNMDLDTFRLLISLLYAYSPAVLSRVICYNVHWLIRPVLKLIIKLIPAQVNKDILVLTGAQELEDYIDHDQLPHFLGGTRDDMKVNVPFENSRSMTEVSPERHNMTVAEAEKLLKDYRRNLSKVKKEVF